MQQGVHTHARVLVAIRRGALNGEEDLAPEVRLRSLSSADSQNVSDFALQTAHALGDADRHAAAVPRDRPRQSRQFKAGGGGASLCFLLPRSAAALVDDNAVQEFKRWSIREGASRKKPSASSGPC